MATANQALMNTADSVVCSSLRSGDSFATKRKKLESKATKEIQVAKAEHNATVRPIRKRMDAFSGVIAFNMEKIAELEPRAETEDTIPTQIDRLRAENVQAQSEIIKLQREITYAEEELNDKITTINVNLNADKDVLEAEEDDERNQDQNLGPIPNEITLNSHQKVTTWQAGLNPGHQTVKDFEDKESDIGSLASSSPNKSNPFLDVATLAAALEIRDAKNKGQNKIIDKSLPMFSGLAEDWLMFKCEYERTTKKYGYDDSENIIRLRKYLKGTAKEKVKHLLSNPENATKVMEVLERLFGKPENLIDEMIRKATKLPAPDISKPETVINYSIAVEAVVSNIKTSKRPYYLQDTRLLRDLFQKLCPAMQMKWVEHSKEESNLEDFSVWLVEQSEYVSKYFQFKIKSDKSEKEDEDNKKNRKRNRGSVNVTAEDEICLICKKTNHQTEKCSILTKKKTAEEREELLREKKLCLSCLKPKCIMARCKSRKSCGIDGCEGWHHRLIHKEVWKKKDKSNRKNKDESTIEVDEEDLADGAASEANSGDDPSSFNTFGSSDNLPILPIRIRGPTGKEKEVFCLCDSGASSAVIDENLAFQLGLTGEKSTFTYTAFGGSKRSCSSKMVQLEVGPRLKRRKFCLVKKVRTVPDLNLPRRTFDAEVFRKNYSHMSNLSAKSMKNAKPLLLLGTAEFPLYGVDRRDFNSDDFGRPWQIDSFLGQWVSYDSKQIEEHCYLLDESPERQDDELHYMVRDFFVQEKVDSPVKQMRSQEDEAALKILEETTRQIGDRWETGLLWKNKDIKMPRSEKMTLNRLRGMERKMDAVKKDFGQLCTEKFEDYFSKGYLQEIKGPVPERSNRWYLPWFFAYHPSKKPRLVFDAAAKAQGQSLNDFLLKGPDLIENIQDVLMRFRIHTISLTADIKEMFHQVQLREEDRPSQTILYRGTERKEAPKKYEMTVLFFGSKSSPCSAIYTKNRNAELYNKTYPDASRAIQEDMYVDDYIGGAETEEEAIKLQKDMSYISKKGGFPLVKWNSSSYQVCQKIPQDLLLPSAAVKLFDNKSEVEYEKTLGLSLDMKEDKFKFQCNFVKIPDSILKGKERPTKRQMVSLVMSVFDPLGFLAPLKMKALSIVQHVWRSKTKCGWDERIHPELMELWTTWLMELQTIESFSLPRRLSQTNLKAAAKNLQLHIFCDASSEAYAAVAYFRICTGSAVEVSFVTGKARVAPVKGFISIPRGELNSALLAARMAHHIKRAYNGRLKIDKTYYWSDSKTVLCWIRTQRQSKTYVAARVGEILETSDASEWNWVPSKLNVADDGTRTGTPIDFEHYRWTTPEFLSKNPEDWPAATFLEQDKKFVITSSEEHHELDEDNPELEDLPTLCTVAEEPTYEIDSIPDVQRFSQWWRLVRATARVFAAVRVFRSQLKKNKVESQRSHVKRISLINISDVRKAKIFLIRKSQEQSFSDEVAALRKGNNVSNNSRIFEFSPELNNDGVIVMGGRIDKSNVSTTIKKPPILCPKDDYTKLLIDFYHKAGKHFGHDSLRNELRQQVWILGAGAAVKRCFDRCMYCQIRRAKSKPPMMGQLPAWRLATGKPPFYFTGVDYFGPITVKILRSRVKRWGVLFCCLTTRAVHLDVADSLSTDDYLACLTRFIGLRGKPRKIISDNGKYFVGAQHVFRELSVESNQEQLQTKLLEEDIEFEFISPASPHMGGSWERLVGLTKKLLHTYLRDGEMTDSGLRTALAEITGILNSRPLTHVSPDPNDDECLTPNHFLNIRCLEGPIVPGIQHEKEYLQKAWEKAQLAAENFWRKFSVEYLPWLAKRGKWIKPQEPIKEGDLVVVLEDNALRNAWKKGVVTKTYPAADGQVRKLQVKISSVDPVDKKVKVSILDRPTVKVCRLELGGIAPEAAGRENVAAQAEEEGPSAGDLSQ